MMTTSTKWRRVSKRRPCPVCLKRDGCLVAGPADDPTAALCARVESPKRCGEAGWLHRLRTDDNGRPGRRTVGTIPLRPAERPAVDLGAYARQCHLATHPLALRQFAEGLGVSVESLGRLSVGWSSRHSAWTFPMADADGKVVGIRLRLRDGHKLAVRGGREALFIPEGLQPGGRLLVAEGPTDAAAVLDLSFDVIGRPSCGGGVRLLVELVRQQQPSEVVIVADSDGPGDKGAESLAGVLVAYCPAVKLIAPPAGIKDARAWKRSGATAADVQRAIDAAEPRRLAISVKRNAGRPCKTATA